MGRWRFMLILILLLNVVLPISLASQNVNEAKGDGNIRDHIMDHIYKYISSGPTPRILKTVGVAIGVASATIFIARIIVYFLLCCMGFTNSGIRGGSYAATRQSYHGNVGAGSHFSRAQSMGASINMGRNYCSGLIFGIPAGAIAGYYAWFYFAILVETDKM